MVEKRGTHAQAKNIEIFKRSLCLGIVCFSAMYFVACLYQGELQPRMDVRGTYRKGRYWEYAGKGRLTIFTTHRRGLAKCHPVQCFLSRIPVMVILKKR